jgi:two-component system sensor kinase FixL
MLQEQVLLLPFDGLRTLSVLLRTPSGVPHSDNRTMFSKDAQALMEAAVDAVIVIDHRGRMIAVNDAARRAFGYRVDEMLGQNVSMLMPPSEAQHHDACIARHLDTGEARVIGRGREVMALRQDGSLFPARLSVGRMPDRGPPRFVGLLRDITAEREAAAAVELAAMTKERLARVSRLATVGEMASGLAHELSQPLTAINTYARACERYLDNPKPDLAEVRDAVREVVLEVQRAGRVIERLRQQVRHESGESQQPLDLNSVIEELAELMQADARAFDARLELSMGKDLPHIRGDPGQLQQVVLNLVRNSLEALADLPTDERHVRLATTAGSPGGVELTVTDDGPGISPTIADRLFHPFATTKKNGTGLGLAMSRTIVQAHGGTISAHEATPRGTRVLVRLPALEGRA